MLQRFWNKDENRYATLDEMKYLRSGINGGVERLIIWNDTDPMWSKHDIPDTYVPYWQPVKEWDEELGDIIVDKEVYIGDIINCRALYPYHNITLEKSNFCYLVWSAINMAYDSAVEVIGNTHDKDTTCS